ncbi:aspartyl protease family protein [Flaviaesturariibacter amylovorans]|uniref:Peptidase A2 domain-containing protein n=1 Tax=Flaviaesturariibacter amylovorans TaxID=1084520 RepID=A0ABP8G7Q2_9BACT
MRRQTLVLLLIFLSLASAAQTRLSDSYISTKEGVPIMVRHLLIDQCLESLNTDRADTMALAMCTCQADGLDRRFTNKQLRQNTRKGEVDYDRLINTDTVLRKELGNCFRRSGFGMLLSARNFPELAREYCREQLQKMSKEPLSERRLDAYCDCQVKLVQAKGLSDSAIKMLGEAGSLLSLEFLHDCGDPFSDKGAIARNWYTGASADLTGPDADTLRVVTVRGMTYVKMRIGKQLRVWMLDSGASDLLINEELEEQLKQEGVLGKENYLGTFPYTMANGSIDSLRQYRVQQLVLGRYTINNLLLGVTKKGRTLLIGKTLLNKFSRWYLDNRQNLLVLTR